MVHKNPLLSSFSAQRMPFKEGTLLQFQPDEDKTPILPFPTALGEKEKAEAAGLAPQEEQALKADLNFLGGYAKPVTEIAAFYTTKQYGKAWSLFYETFLKDPVATEKYMNLVSQKYNLLYYLQKIPVAGLSFKIPYALMRGAVGVTNWGVGVFKKNFGSIAGSTNSVFAIFKNASTTWESLTKEQQAAFMNFAESMAKNLPVDTILQSTHQQYMQALGGGIHPEGDNTQAA